jgi:elongation factor Ts
MSSIDTTKKIREETLLPIQAIKKALDKAGGDKIKALELLKEQGATVAAKKSSRSTREGVVHAYVHGNSKVGVMLELLCETDFVARNSVFPELAHNITMHIAAMDPEDVTGLLEQKYIKDESITIEELIKQAIGKLGENIKVGKFIRYSI